MTESMKSNPPERLVRRDQNVAVVQRFYGAAATHDESKVVPVLTEDFVGQTTESGRITPKPQMCIVGCPQVWLWKISR